MAWKTCSYLVPCSSKKKKRKKKEELRLNRWTEHRDALSIKLWCYRWVYRVDPEKVCNRANKKIGSMITCAHGTRTKACHGQVYLCFLRRIWATRELTHVTIEKKLDDDRAKKCARDSATIKQHPRTILSFLFTIEQMELYAFLREKLKEGKRLLRIRVGFIGAILSKKTVLRILMQRKFDPDGRVLLANSCISLSSFCLDRWRNFETRKLDDFIFVSVISLKCIRFFFYLLFLNYSIFYLSFF